MGKTDLPGLCTKDGRLDFRRKIGGKDTYLRLPALDDPRFAEAYARAARPEAVRARPAAGTFAALVMAYRATGKFRTIRSEATRTNRERYLEMIAAEHGHRTVKGCRPADVVAMRDAYADKPGKANNWLATL